MKVLCRDLAKVRSRLAELQAVLEASGTEHNIVFDTPGGDLRKADSLLRLRRYGNAVVTYKGPRGEKGVRAVRSRTEIETEVSDFDAAKMLLESLGYVKTWIYEKRREKWVLGEAEVALDTLPFIGDYVEIEAADEKKVMETFGLLGLSQEDVTPYTYIEIFLEYLDSNGLDFRDLVFEREDDQ
ncbi:MAG: class IV adenylate cyclase [Planctomycetes bacterium]|nr:class IV adenylate cyclase [Planctomycetota bacterium]